MKRRGFILVGVLFIVCGLMYGVMPQKTPYQSITKVFLAHYLSGRGIGYMQMEKSSTLYIVNEGDLLPAFSADYLNHGNVLISFLFRTDETTSIDASSGNKVHLVGPAYTVERITLYHQYGQQPVIFTTHGYFQNPNGYYQHNWKVGIALSILGIIIIGSGLFIKFRQGKKKKQLDFANTTETVLEGADPGQEQETATGYVE